MTGRAGMRSDPTASPTADADGRPVTPTSRLSRLRPRVMLADVGSPTRAETPVPEAVGTLTRMDTHVHSKASDGPAAAALGFIGCPESYSEPEQVYAQARARGMDLVTLTDHDTIAGALHLVERGFQGTVIGQEVTVRFPEDRCKLHVLVWTLTPDLHEQIETLRLRDDVYAFAEWLKDRDLPHALAHPLYIQNGKLTRWHLERCAILFKGFETLNGAHTVTHRGALERFLDALTPRRLLDLTNKHGIEPLWPRAWEKARTGGSDDHALLNIGRTWTQVRSHGGSKITDPRDFFRAVMKGQCEPGGEGGHPSLLAHQLTSVGARYAASRGTPKSVRSKLIRAKLIRFAGVDEKSPGRSRLVLDAALAKLRRRRASLPVVAALRRSIGPVLARHPELRARLDPARWDDGSALSSHEEMESFSAELVRAMSEVMQSGLASALKGRDARAAVDHFLSHAIVQAAQLPYVFSLFHQNKERWFVEQIDQATGLGTNGTAGGLATRPLRVMLFTDTLGDVNGVSRFINTMADEARAAGRDLTVCTSTNIPLEERPNVRNFKPLVATKMPGYNHLELAMPPLLEMLRHADRAQPDVIHISTPGTVGLVGRLAGAMLKIPVVGTYHTDFPAYVERIFDDHIMTDLATAFMRLFYKRFARVLTRSADYVPKVAGLGLEVDRVRPLTAGCDTRLFNAKRRDRSIWKKYHAECGTAPEGVKVVYCGRVSVEKNLPKLAAIWRLVRAKLDARGLSAELVIVGDGPYRPEMESELGGMGARFLGYRYGEELATIYASADLFAFPSTTDTLGQVVMEAQSSGLPAVVTDEGGPKEIVEDGVTGFVASIDDPNRWAERIVELIADADLRRSMGDAGFAMMQERSILRSFEEFWQTHEDVFAAHLESKGLTRHAEPVAF